MLELLVCSLFTIVPDYLYRHYAQGKRLGQEITLYSVWYELRYGLTACLMLTVGLITIIFYHHPSATIATAVFRSIPIVPETSGRVRKIYVGVSGAVKKNDPIFELDSDKQAASLELAKLRVAEIDAAAVMARAEIAAAEGQIQQARSALANAEDELATKQELARRNSGTVAEREIEKLKNVAEEKRGALVAATASRDAAETRVTTLLPAEKASAQAAVQQAAIELDRMTVRAGVDGQVEQFALREGDLVSPLMRPAGVLIPDNAGRWQIVAGFDQIEGQVLTAGMTAEVTCLSKPWSIIPMVVTRVQDYIASGQFRTSDQLLDTRQLGPPGTITVFLEPLFENGLEGVAPGSSCLANAYTNSHAKLVSDDIGLGTWIYLHIVDTVGAVHAVMLRLQALLLPIKTLVLSGH